MSFKELFFNVNVQLDFVLDPVTLPAPTAIIQPVNVPAGSVAFTASSSVTITSYTSKPTGSAAGTRLGHERSLGGVALVAGIVSMLL